MRNVGKHQGFIGGSGWRNATAEFKSYVKLVREKLKQLFQWTMLDASGDFDVFVRRIRDAI